MCRIWVIPCFNLYQLLQGKLATALLFTAMFLACSLPPKPRFINKPTQPERAPTARPERSQEKKHDSPFRASTAANQKNTVAQATTRAKTMPEWMDGKNFDERLLSALGVFLNAPYELGGVTPEGVDCSGLVQSVFAAACGLDLPHNAASQSRFGVAIAEADLRLGDLIFFETSIGRRRFISHVGIYLTKRRFAHASTKAGVIVSSLDEAYWRRRYAGARRLIERP